MAGTPVRNLVLTRRGQKSMRVATEWENTWEDGTITRSLSPVFDPRDYNGRQVEMPLLEALELVAKKEGYLRFYDIARRDRDDDFGA